MKSNEEGSWSYNRAQEALVQRNDELNQAEKQRTEISQQLSATTDRHNALLGQAAAAQNKYYDSLVRMTGQGALFRQTLEDINEAMVRNASIAAVPLRIPQAPVSDKDQETLLRKQQQAELAGLT
ncbi:hypothetical protein ISU77_17170, partial [Leptospira borgpetersenii serovar Hardjo-bovis]|nr:hypothetical protein [Leptospira borgpetersenii serovar Hardjo-bovis]